MGFSSVEATSTVAAVTVGSQTRSQCTANDTTAPAKPAGAMPQLKLLVDKRSHRVLYAKAHKDAYYDISNENSKRVSKVAQIFEPFPLHWMDQTARSRQ
uniref:Uncharacterized protein n=1 Tax=Oryza nivara TaxID=4536 RepID=A0A0E0HKL7_ORYNI